MNTSAGPLRQSKNISPPGSEGTSMILITGATGTVGSEVVKQLAATGAPLRALVRNLEKANQIRRPGVELAQGDFDKPETLGAALAGAEKVFLLSSPDPRQVELQGNLIEAARRSGVRHIVKLSAIGAAAESPVRFLRWHWQTEKQLEQSGIAYTHLRPHYFMQNTLGFAGAVAGQNAIYMPMKDARISMVDVRDVAAVAVAALTRPGHAGKTYDVTGPEALSFTQVAEKLSTALGRKVTHIEVTPAVAKQGMMSAGFPEGLADGVLELNAGWNGGGAAYVTRVVAEVGKVQPHTFDQFAREFAPAFQKSQAQAG